MALVRVHLRHCRIVSMRYILCQDLRHSALIPGHFSNKQRTCWYARGGGGGASLATQFLLFKTQTGGAWFWPLDPSCNSLLHAVWIFLLSHSLLNSHLCIHTQGILKISPKLSFWVLLMRFICCLDISLSYNSDHWGNISSSGLVMILKSLWLSVGQALSFNPHYV